MPIISVRKFSRSKVPDPQPEPEQSNKIIREEEPERYEEPEHETEHEGYASPDEDRDDTDNEFLADLHKSNYNPIDPKQEKEDLKRLKQEQREELKKEREHERMIKRAEKSIKKSKVQVSRGNDDDDIFSDHGTEILGKDKHLLLKKVGQYKSLFKDELKTFKVKRNASEGELKAYLDEMQTVVEINTLDEFLTDSIIQCIKIVEGVSSLTKNYNITGLADMLKSNKQFNNLLKVLFVKYGSYQSMPPEWQLALLVATSSFMCMQKNRNKSQINSYLNEPIPIPATNK